MIRFYAKTTEIYMVHTAFFFEKLYFRQEFRLPCQKTSNKLMGHTVANHPPQDLYRAPHQTLITEPEYFRW